MNNEQSIATASLCSLCNSSSDGTVKQKIPPCAVQATIMKPEVTLYRCQSSSAVVLELCTELEHLAHSCRNMEGRASLACAEVALSHVMHAPYHGSYSHSRTCPISRTHACQPHSTVSCLLQTFMHRLP